MVVQLLIVVVRAMAIPQGRNPTGTVVVTVLVAVSITDTMLSLVT